MKDDWGSFCRPMEIPLPKKTKPMSAHSKAKWEEIRKYEAEQNLRVETFRGDMKEIGEREEKREEIRRLSAIPDRILGSLAQGALAGGKIGFYGLVGTGIFYGVSIAALNRANGDGSK